MLPPITLIAIEIIAVISGIGVINVIGVIGGIAVDTRNTHSYKCYWCHGCYECSLDVRRMRFFTPQQLTLLQKEADSNRLLWRYLEALAVSDVFCLARRKPNWRTRSLR